MNKYEEAFSNYMTLSGFVKSEMNYDMPDLQKSYEAMKELVARATPKKPSNLYTYVADGGEKVENGECPNCHKTMVRTMDVESSFCDHCGQALEWEGK